jgi:hypothetical protein
MTIRSFKKYLAESVRTYNYKIKIAGVEIGIMDAVSAYLMQYPVGQETKLYGYALHIDVTGTKDGKKLRYLLTHTHPASDGSTASTSSSPAAAW